MLLANKARASRRTPQHADLTAVLRAMDARLRPGLDEETALAELAALIVPEFADWCAIDRVSLAGRLHRTVVADASQPDPSGMGGRAPRSQTPDPSGMGGRAPRSQTPDPSGMGGRAPRSQSAPGGGAGESCQPTGVISHAILRKRPLLIAPMSEEALTVMAGSAAEARRLRGAGCAAGLVLPLVAADHCIATVSLLATHSAGRYDEQQLTLLTALASRAALIIENSRLWQTVVDCEARYGAMLSDLDVIVWEADPDTLRYTFVSSRAVSLLGYPLWDWTEQEDFWVGKLHPDDRERILSEHLSAITAGADHELEYRIYDAAGRVRWFHDLIRVQAAEEDGQPLLRGLMVDVTGRREAEEATRFSQSLLASQSEASPYGTVVISPCGPILTHNHRFAELWGFTDAQLHDGSAEALLRSAAEQTTDPERFLDRVAEVWRHLDRSLRDEVQLRDGRVLERFVTPILGPDGTQHCVAVYLRDVTAERQIRAELVEAGERSARLAYTLQQSLLPPHMPRIPGFELSARYRTAGDELEIGGDFYDVFRTARGRWAIMMGDVQGKGAEAAALAARVRHSIRATAHSCHSPARVLYDLNDVMLRDGDCGDRLVTIAYGILRRHRDGVDLELASGGHPLPLLLRADGTVATIGRHGTLLGLLADVEFTDVSVTMRTGDTLLLYTDGAVEATNPDGEEFGAARLATHLAACAGQSADAVLTRIESAVGQWRGGVLRDDTALLALRIAR